MSSRRLIIKPILPLVELKSMVTPEEWRAAESKFSTIHRRQEWLSWRGHLRHELQQNPQRGVENNFRIEYLESGAPYIVDTQVYISVSHTKTDVAIIISDTPCAVDMELLERNFTRISSRYISPQEESIITTDTLRAVAWCAKEATYKYIQKESVNMLQDIVITNISDKYITIKTPQKEIIAKYTLHDKFAIVEI